MATRLNNITFSSIICVSVVHGIRLRLSFDSLRSEMEGDHNFQIILMDCTNTHTELGNRGVKGKKVYIYNQRENPLQKLQRILLFQVFLRAILYSCNIIMGRHYELPQLNEKCVDVVALLYRSSVVIILEVAVHFIQRCQFVVFFILYEHCCWRGVSLFFLLFIIIRNVSQLATLLPPSLPLFVSLDYFEYLHHTHFDWWRYEK